MNGPVIESSKQPEVLAALVARGQHHQPPREVPGLDDRTEHHEEQQRQAERAHPAALAPSARAATA